MTKKDKIIVALLLVIVLLGVGNIALHDRHYEDNRAKQLEAEHSQELGGCK